MTRAGLNILNFLGVMSRRQSAVDRALALFI